MDLLQHTSLGNDFAPMGLTYLEHPQHSHHRHGQLEVGHLCRFHMPEFRP